MRLKTEGGNPGVQGRGPVDRSAAGKCSHRACPRAGPVRHGRSGTGSTSSCLNAGHEQSGRPSSSNSSIPFSSSTTAASRPVRVRTRARAATAAGRCPRSRVKSSLPSSVASCTRSSARRPAGAEWASPGRRDVSRWRCSLAWAAGGWGPIGIVLSAGGLGRAPTGRAGLGPCGDRRKVHQRCKRRAHA